MVTLVSSYLNKQVFFFILAGNKDNHKSLDGISYPSPTTKLAAFEHLKNS